MPARVRREMIATCGRARVITGSTRLRQPFSPPVGNQPSIEANTISINGAVTKVGTHTPSTATAVAA